MEQFTPTVSEFDVDRILRRDVPSEAQEEIRAMIQRLEVREKPRVVLACIKASGGDVRKLKGNLAQAEGYYREIISEAEYPNYTKKLFHIDKLPDAEQSKIIEQDKSQYLAWFHGAND